MAKKRKPPKPKKRSGESSKEFKARKKEWKREQALIEQYRKAGIDDPEFFAQQRGERPAPPPPHERPIPTTKSREDGGQRHDGSYVRRSTVDLSKIEAHLDTKMEKDKGESLHERFKSEFGEDLSAPDGYDLIPDRDVHVRAGPPTLASTESGLSDQVLADAYGDTATAPVPPPAPEPAPVAAEPDAEIEPEPVAEMEPEPVAEIEPEPEVEVESEPMEEEAPEPEPVAPPVAVPEPGAVAGVAGVAGAAPGATEAAAKEAAPVEDDIDPPEYPFLHLRRFIKIGRRAWIKGGGLAKTIVGLVNFFLYVGLVWPLPPIFILPLAVTLIHWNKKRKAEAEAAEAEWEAHVAEHGYPEEGGYGDGYYGEEYAAEGGYYEGEGGHYEDDRYGY
jgi:hypothetical protein